MRDFEQTQRVQIELDQSLENTTKGYHPLIAFFRFCKKNVPFSIFKEKNVHLVLFKTQKCVFLHAFVVFKQCRI